MEFLRPQCHGAERKSTTRPTATLNSLLALICAVTLTLAPCQIAGNPLPTVLSTETTATTGGPPSDESPTENTTAPAAGPLRDFEVEGKWEIPDVSTYDALVERFANGSEFLNYTAVVRWGNTCRKYVDYYYDTASLELTEKMNSLRHRTRYQASPPAASNAWLDVKLASWVTDWDLIQYKGSPSRVGAIWGREEVGSRESEPDQPTSHAVISSCGSPSRVGAIWGREEVGSRESEPDLPTSHAVISSCGSPSRVGAIWGREEVGSRESEPDLPTSHAVISSCGSPSRVGAIWGREEVGSRESEPDQPTSHAVISACDLSYDAIRVMKREHPQLDCADLRPSLKVDDYRLRIGLEDENSVRLFEVSLDRYLLTDYLFNSWPFGAMEVEIEIAGNITEESVRSLGAVAAALEEEFPGLRRSTYSKGGLFLPEAEGTVAGLMCGGEGWPCSGDYTCVPRGQRCDGVADCGDGSDERQCPSDRK
ncbi:uncharacterized protein LOC118409201 [Branchiostoma floridae]|uniref:Uncharacterized protein LOC118409201 n=1 Tax=Branchiostoma floridae TaxID=7739 RepID=A0A9J7KM10_BRAFL|nr:uncharacterized protein LOC118409201 [Branchiostoma floridae]